MPGGFHPFHAGHMALYNSARKAFPDADLYVAATNSQETRPFPFAVKEKLAKVAGVAPGHFVQVKSPFQAKEITQNYDPERDVLIFVRSEKDRNESPKPGGMKKDGTPAYFQPYTGKNLQPFAKHAYFAYLPTVEFGPGITSATEIRKAWPTLNDRRKTAMVMSLYPATQNNPKLAANVVAMLDQVMGGQEDVAEGSDGWIGNPAKWKEAVLQAHGPDVVFKNYSHPGQPGKRSVNAFDTNNKIVGVYQRHNKMGMVQPNQQGMTEGAPIVIAQAPIDVRNPKKAPQPYRNQGDIVPPTKPPSTEKRGVKGRPGQRPMPNYEVEEGAEEALQYATQAHAGQTRAGGDPYITHPMRVADHIKQYKQSHNLDALISAAYLHDTVEDTDTTHEALHDLFGGLVASLVKELTSDPEQIKKMGKAQYLAHKMAAMSSYALVIKLADRLDNVKDITTARTPEWRQKYKNETEHILNYIEKTRALSGTHQKLIELIRAKLSELDNPQPEVDEGFGLPMPGTYEQEHDMNQKQSGHRTHDLTSESSLSESADYLEEK